MKKNNKEVATQAKTTGNQWIEQQARDFYSQKAVPASKRHLTEVKK